MKNNRIVSLFLMFVVLVCAISPVSYADTNIPSPRFSDFTSVYAGIYDEGNGIYTMEGGATANSGSKKVVVTLTLEKANGNRWEAVPGYSWTASGMISAHTSASRSLSPGTYQAHLHAQVYQGSTLLETADAYSYVQFVD